jgi:hypothetical protein
MKYCTTHPRKSTVTLSRRSEVSEVAIFSVNRPIISYGSLQLNSTSTSYSKYETYSAVFHKRKFSARETVAFSSQLNIMTKTNILKPNTVTTNTLRPYICPEKNNWSDHQSKRLEKHHDIFRCIVNIPEDEAKVVGEQKRIKI